MKNVFLFLTVICSSICFSQSELITSIETNRGYLGYRIGKKMQSDTMPNVVSGRGGFWTGIHDEYDVSEISTEVGNEFFGLKMSNVELWISQSSKILRAIYFMNTEAGLTTTFEYFQEKIRRSFGNPDAQESNTSSGFLFNHLYWFGKKMTVSAHFYYQEFNAESGVHSKPIYGIVISQKTSADKRLQATQ